MHLTHDEMHNCIDTGFFGKPPVAQVALGPSSPSGHSSAGPRQLSPAIARERQATKNPPVELTPRSWTVGS